ncbi:hypothetical protein BDV93DRAFT_520988 [Ceratobasidium sp. AG-I]|nr:hypothetical protein BDV93DRAFT_520988 [Ceratobasidium sp. AG-I]
MLKPVLYLIWRSHHPGTHILRSALPLGLVGMNLGVPNLTSTFVEETLVDNVQEAVRGVGEVIEKARQGFSR